MHKHNGILRAFTTLVGCVLALGLVAGLSGCGKNDEELVRAAVTEAMEPFKNPTEENLKPYVEDSSIDTSELDQYGIDLYEFMGHSFAKFDYKINDVKVDGDTAKAELTVTNVDLGSVIETVTNEITSHPEEYADIIYGEDGQREFMKLFFDKIYEELDKSEETVSSDVTLEFEKSDGEWKVVDSSISNVVSGMFGGLQI